ncbi:MAG TPA: hypothetical protein VJ802_03030 [Gemmatimonadaceae bacterium]|nr:hypothetical protein [Gemmatimonadaceae bacterium]
MRHRLPLVLAAAALVATACRPEPQQFALRLDSDSYSFRVTADPLPPRARERTVYTVVVSDRKTKQPIEGGEGRIFASNAGPDDPDRRTVWDGLASAEQVGTYTANMNFVTAGNWAMAVEFRRDSTSALERIDWRQDIHAEGPAFPGDTSS